MPKHETSITNTERHSVASIFLKRTVLVDFYLPLSVKNPAEMSLLLINDGQDLVTMQFENILDELYRQNKITALLCIGIHCGPDRKNEYATAKIADYKGWGTTAAAYSQFIFEELLPYIHTTCAVASFKEKSFAGFSLGGLSALDIVWNNAHEFTKAGIFSGSLWWRDKDQQHPEFDERQHRIMHRQIREGTYAPWLKFFFEAGALDETADRNNNGIIDSIDDTIDLIGELKTKGYNHNSIAYLELKDGRHDVPTWAKAFPDFLQWGWGV